MTPTKEDKMSKVKVSKIKIDLGKDQIIELTMEQARELQEVLNDTLGKRETVIVRSDPVIIDRHPWYPRTWYRDTPPYWYVSFGDTAAGSATTPITSGTITYSLNSENPVS
jgi:hypothetical protein